MIISLGNNVYVNAKDISAIMPSSIRAVKELMKSDQYEIINITGGRKCLSVVITEHNQLFKSCIRAETLFKRTEEYQTTED